MTDSFQTISDLDLFAGESVLIISPVAPFPSNHGNRKRILNLLRELKSMGAKVTLILQLWEQAEERAPEMLELTAREVDQLIMVPPRDFPKPSPENMFSKIQRKLKSLMAPRTASAWYSLQKMDTLCWSETEKLVLDTAAKMKPRFVICEYAFMSKILPRISKTVIKIIDAVEVFSRNLRQYEKYQVKAYFACSAEEERKSLQRADLVLAIQEKDASYLKRLLPSTKILTLPHIFEPPAGFIRKPRPFRILYVPSNNRFNQISFTHFLNEAWPFVTRALPQAELYVVGKIGKHVLSRDRVRFLGTLTDEQLWEEYASCAVVINPQEFGTGLKIKCVEALGCGCPLIVREASAEGIEEGAEKAFRIATDWPQFADSIIQVLTDDSLRHSLAIEAKKFAEKMFSRAAVRKTIEQMVPQKTGSPWG